MDLRCKIGHLFGGYVDVDGAKVEVGTDGVARDVSDEAAKTLLMDKTGWAEHVVEIAEPAAPKPQPKAPAAPPPSTEKKDEPSTASAPASSDKTEKTESGETDKSKKKRRGMMEALGLGGKDKE